MRLGTTLLIVLLQLAPLAVAPALAQDPDGTGDVEADTMKMSKEEAYYTFEETVGRVTVFVGGQLAGLEEARAYVPVQIAIGVTGKGPELEISNRNFELHDAYGKVHEAATAEEVQKDGIVQFASDWVKANPLNTGNSFVNYGRVSSNFYPVTQGGTTDAHLDRETFLVDVIYFPKPEDLHGELMLSFYAEGMKEGAVNVRFKALLNKKKKKKKKKG